MKLKLLIFSILLSHPIYSQSAKDSLFQKDINVLVEEMEFMYGYDQTMREYTIFKTFDKSETDRIENLPDSLRVEKMKNRKFESDSIAKLIWRKYINPMDAEHTERMIEITKKYGFPSTKRIKKYYDKEFVDPEFNPLIIFVHSPKKYWEELKELMLNEYQNGVINQCQYGYALWQFTGRKSFQPMLDNGFEMLEENGKTRLTPTCD
ncbi:MAG: hypothetical protein L0J45_06470 [Psychroflexus sp.]|nr:hypothetical protein [Psychroflexus sp.]MDN6309408.1 hypothetical protein [Psychroflexus sp.]